MKGCHDGCSLYCCMAIIKIIIFDRTISFSHHCQHSDPPSSPASYKEQRTISLWPTISILHIVHRPGHAPRQSSLSASVRRRIREPSGGRASRAKWVLIPLHIITRRIGAGAGAGPLTDALLVDAKCHLFRRSLGGHLLNGARRAIWVKWRRVVSFGDGTRLRHHSGGAEMLSWLFDGAAGACLWVGRGGVTVSCITAQNGGFHGEGRVAGFHIEAIGLSQGRRSGHRQGPTERRGEAGRPSLSVPSHAPPVERHRRPTGRNTATGSSDHNLTEVGLSGERAGTEPVTEASSVLGGGRAFCPETWPVSRSKAEVGDWRNMTRKNRYKF